MKQTAVLAVAAAAIFGMSAPAMADYVRIGSIDVANFVNDWATVKFAASTTSLTAGTSTSSLSSSPLTVAHGGTVYAEAPETAVIYGMPGAAVRTGEVDKSMPLGALGTHLAELIV